jgi:hypothetical protein
MGCFLVGWGSSVFLSESQADTPSVDVFQPSVLYQVKGRRDPFIRSQPGSTYRVVTRVDITILRLTGVISHPQRSLALFNTQTGPRFGYILKGGQLYRENNQLVLGITGEIVNRNEVVLKQGDKRILYRLR